MAPSGAAVATWFEIGGNKHLTVRAARRPAGGAFGAPEQLASIAATGIEPDNRLEAGIADDGTATVAWTQRTSSGTIAQLKRCRWPSPSAPLAAVRGRPDGRPVADAFALAVAADGRALLVADGERVLVAERPPGGAFGAR